MIAKFKINNDKEKELFVFPYGLDDFIIFLCCLKQYKEKNKNKKLHVAVLAPHQEGFTQPSFLKEFGKECKFIEEIYELHNVVTNEKKVQVDKKALQANVQMIDKFNNFSKIEVIELAAKINKDDYRYNIYFQFCTLLGLPHEKPIYSLPKVEKGASKQWKRDFGILNEDKYIVVQLKSKFPIKDANIELFNLVKSKINMDESLKIIEVGKKVLDNSVLVDPEEVKTTTLIDIIRDAEFVICNNSLVYTLSCILGKKTYCIMNPASANIIRDYVFKNKKDDIVLLATDETLADWERIKASCPFIFDNEPFTRNAYVNLSSINFYNPNEKKNRLSKKILKERDECIKLIEKGVELDKPLIWYKQDAGCLNAGNYKNDDASISLQALDGIPQLLAYEAKGIEKINVNVTNIFKAFY
jgi:hypothetical protein